MKQLALCLTGASNSGKTTLICKISKALKQRGFKVAIIKHDPKDKAVFDTALNEFGEPKDSAKFFETGADVAVLSPKRTSIFKRADNTGLSDILGLFSEFDYLLIEGFKNLPLPRISVVRDEINDEYLGISDAFVTNLDDERLSPRFGLDDIENIIAWIDKNAKKV